VANSTRYFVTRRRDGTTSRLVRVRRDDSGLYGEFFRDGAWQPNQYALNYLFDPSAGHEIPEPEAQAIAHTAMHGSSRLTDRFDQAMLLAHQLHRDQVRNDTSIPYVAHLLGVASLALEDGGSEDEAIAALLHDAVEDQGGRPTLERIRTQFGERVARIVESCTDEVLEPGQQPTPWRERKEAYLRRLALEEPTVRRVSLADKLQNATAILRDYRHVGEAVWSRFSGGRDGVLWYYRALADVHASTPSTLVPEFVDAVGQLERLAATM
jgi:(p)ppGpp synthase/HD superfamily hydrolase